MSDKYFGKRLKSLREKRGLTQKELGLAIGLSENSAESTISQYEREAKKPRLPTLFSICGALNVLPSYFDPPSLDSPPEFLKTILELEDTYGLQIKKIDNQFYIGVDQEAGDTRLTKELKAWYEAKQMLEKGEFTIEQYDYWKFYYPLVKPSSSFEKEKDSLVIRGYTISEDETDLWKIFTTTKRDESFPLFPKKKDKK